MDVVEGGVDVAELRRELERERRELAASIGELEHAVAIGSRLRAVLVRGGALVLGLEALLVLVVGPVRRRRRRPDRVIATFDQLALVSRRR